MNVGIKRRVHWLAGYGISRATLKLLARRGDPLAQLMIDTHQTENMYQLVEEVRLRGHMSSFPGGGLVTADARIVREVLRDDRFRTLKPRDRSPFRLTRWILAKTDPNVLNATEPPSMLVTDNSPVLTSTYASPYPPLSRSMLSRKLLREPWRRSLSSSMPGVRTRTISRGTMPLRLTVPICSAIATAIPCEIKRPI